FVHEVLLHPCRALDVQDIARGDRTVTEGLAGLDEVVLLNQDVLAQRHQVGLVLSGTALHDDLAVTPLDLAVGDDTVDLAHHGRIARVTCLEEFRYAGQATGDVTTLTGA